MEMDLNLATIGWKMVEVLSKLKKKQRRSKKIKREGKKSKQGKNKLQFE